MAISTIRRAENARRKARMELHRAEFLDMVVAAEERCEPVPCEQCRGEGKLCLIVVEDGVESEPGVTTCRRCEGTGRV